VGAKSETSCQVCSAGKASGAIDADTEMACVRCPPGFFAGTGSAACMPCPVGDYSEFIGSSDCSSCATGFTTNGTGAKLAGECIPKPVFNTTMPIMTTPSPFVIIIRILRFPVEPSEILAKKAQFELAIANAGGVNASQVNITQVVARAASRRATGSEVTAEITTTTDKEASVRAGLSDDNIKKELEKLGLVGIANEEESNDNVNVGLVVGVVAAVAVALGVVAAFYFNQQGAKSPLKPADVESAPINISEKPPALTSSLGFSPGARA